MRTGGLRVRASLATTNIADFPAVRAGRPPHHGLSAKGPDARGVPAAYQTRMPGELSGVVATSRTSVGP